MQSGILTGFFVALLDPLPPRDSRSPAAHSGHPPDTLSPYPGHGAVTGWSPAGQPTIPARSHRLTGAGPPATPVGTRAAWGKERAMQLSELVHEFLIDCRSRRLAAKTIAWYGANLRYFLEWLAREGQPDALASFTLANGRRYSQGRSERTARRGTFVNGRQRRGVYAQLETDTPLAANTAFGYLRTLKTFSRWLAAEEQGYTARDVMAGLRLPKRPQTREQPLTEAEMGRLLDGYNLRSPVANRDFAILLTYL